MTNVYIDESGNSGDLSLVGEDLSFNNQPIFVMTGIILDDENAFVQHVQDLKSKYKIKSNNELKSNLLLKNKHKMILELVKFFVSTDSKFFIEVVDKRFQLVVNIVDHFLLPPYFMPEITEKDVVMKLAYASFLYGYLEDQILYDYVQITKNPSNDSVREFFRKLKDVLLKDEHEEQNWTAIRLVDQSLDEFEHIINSEKENAWGRFLPIPDKNKRGRLVWMLPNYSSLASIYARINKYANGCVGEYTIIHDDQDHFDEILQDAKKQTEESDLMNCTYMPISVKFDFFTSAQLHFESSHNYVGIQIADVFSGLIRRYEENLLKGITTEELLLEAVHLLLDKTDEGSGVGINRVTPQDIESLEQRLIMINMMESFDFENIL